MCLILLVIHKRFFWPRKISLLWGIIALPDLEKAENSKNDAKMKKSSSWKNLTALQNLGQPILSSFLRIPKNSKKFIISKVILQFEQYPNLEIKTLFYNIFCLLKMDKMLQMRCWWILLFPLFVAACRTDPRFVMW